MKPQSTGLTIRLLEAFKWANWVAWTRNVCETLHGWKKGEKNEVGGRGALFYWILHQRFALDLWKIRSHNTSASCTWLERVSLFSREGNHVSRIVRTKTLEYYALYRFCCATWIENGRLNWYQFMDSIDVQVNRHHCRLWVTVDRDLQPWRWARLKFILDCEGRTLLGVFTLQIVFLEGAGCLLYFHPYKFFLWAQEKVLTLFFSSWVFLRAFDTALVKWT